jgi:hypothetical protein
MKLLRGPMIAAVAATAAFLAGPAAAQGGTGGRLSVAPYVGYGFFGTLPDGPRLEGAVAYGGRLAYQVAPQWALFASGQRSNPEVRGSGDAVVDHWSAGVEFSYAPRGGAEGILPVTIEAGLGEARQEFRGLLSNRQVNDLAVNLGIGSALELSPRLAIRYGANGYIFNFDGDRGVATQVFARLGAELSF